MKQHITKYRKNFIERNFQIFIFGRFLLPDPLFEAFARHTPYHYSYNSPLVWLDPSGLAPEKEKEEERMLEYENEQVLFEIMENNYQESIQERNSAGFSANHYIWGALYMRFGWDAANELIGFFEEGVFNSSAYELYLNNSKSGSVGSAENGVRQFSFVWNGMTIYVKHNSNNTSQEQLTQKISAELTEIAYGDNENVLASLNDLCFDLTMSSVELATLWNNNCKGNYTFLAGFTWNLWNLVSDGGSSNEGCDGSFATGRGWIMLANEYFTGDTRKLEGGYNFDVEKGEVRIQNKSLPLYMIMAHEIKHVYDAKYIYGLDSMGKNYEYSSEPSANHFMYSVWLNNNPGWIIIRKHGERQ